MNIGIGINIGGTSRPTQEEEGMAKWIGPWNIYGLKWQTISFNADDAACSYIFNGQETSAIPFGANAAAYQAAFEALSSVGVGKVQASGTPGSIKLVFDDSIIPTLITVGANTLVLDPDPVMPDIYISHIDLIKDLRTFSPGEIFVDYMIQRVEGFVETAQFYVADDGGSGSFFSPVTQYLVLEHPDNFDNFSGNSESQGDGYGTSPRSVEVGTNASPGELPVICKNETTVSAVIYSAGGTGKTTGIVKVWLCVATPVAP